MSEPEDWTIYDINVKPTPRSGWWLMVLISFDAFVQRWRRG
jgi:hypothetical protein